MSAATITLLFLLFAVVMFVFEKIPLGVTSMIVCIGLVVTGVLDIKTAFAGFIDSNVILFVAMFIVGGALFETGMANKIGGIVTHFARSERSLIVAIMVIVGLMSGVLSNTGTAAVLIPVVIGIAAKSGYARSKLLMRWYLQRPWAATFPSSAHRATSSPRVLWVRSGCPSASSSTLSWACPSSPPASSSMPPLA